MERPAPAEIQQMDEVIVAAKKKKQQKNADLFGQLASNLFHDRGPDVKVNLPRVLDPTPSTPSDAGSLLNR